MMIGVLSLAVGEKLVNTAIGLDPLIQSELKNLSGKTLRVMMRSPNLSVDVLFGDERVRLEPAFEPIFEPQGGIYPNPPECTLTVDNPKHLLALLQNPTGNLPIQGDHQILMRTKYMLEQCHPDIWSWLERLIGQDAVSQLYFIGQEISPYQPPSSITLSKLWQALYHTRYLPMKATLSIRRFRIKNKPYFAYKVRLNAVKPN